MIRSIWRYVCVKKRLLDVTLITLLLRRLIGAKFIVFDTKLNRK